VERPNRQTGTYSCPLCIMMKKLILFILFVPQLSFSQTEKDDYELYSLILSEQLAFGVNNKVDSIILIEQYEDRFDQVYEVFDNESDTITTLDLGMLFRSTIIDTAFVKTLIKEPKYKKLLANLTSNFKNHPKIKPGLLKTDKLYFRLSTSKQFYSFFGKNYNRKNAWKNIINKYGTRNVLEFSNINYNGNYAAAYYGLHCGGLCGTGDIVFFEKVNGSWKILLVINLWMS
jgi:hypothetical protein